MVSRNCVRTYLARKLFGTDGIRGVAGEPPLDARTAHALGVALGKWAREVAGAETSEAPEVIIGMDTRESGPWIVAQVAGGLKRSGVEARFAGVITTPGVAYLARTGPFIAGVMVSASHNPYLDNGIKVIDHAGYKLADSLEERIEIAMFEWLDSGEEANVEILRGSPVSTISIVNTLRRLLRANFRFTSCWIALTGPRPPWLPSYLNVWARA